MKTLKSQQRKSQPKSSRKSQQGSILIEGLISIAIFSFGVLGTMSFQANMIAQSTQTSYRLAASMLVNSLSGAAEADPRNFACYTTASNSATTGMNCDSATDYMTSWKEQVTALKGSSGTAPSAVINSDGDLVISVYWKLPQEVAKEAATGETNVAAHMVTATLHPVILGI
jgi:Tfp pilus assembly protein PilV